MGQTNQLGKDIYNRINEAGHYERK
jgi:hypothetical protein